MQKLALWSCGASPLHESCGANWAALLAKAGAAGSRTDEEGAGHFAQTDAPVVFEKGPLAAVYAALTKPADRSSDSETLLTRCLAQTVEVLGDDFYR